MEAKKIETWTELRASTWASFVRLSLIVTLAVAVCCGSVLVTYASAGTAHADSVRADTGRADTGPGIPKQFAEQEVKWADCGKDGAQCATVKAPMDWKHPDDGDTVDLAIKRYRATGPEGVDYESLFLNPGGPGGSGISYLTGAQKRMPKDMRDSFDLVSWDPRGVGQSTPVNCFEPKEIDELMSAWSDP